MGRIKTKQIKRVSTDLVDSHFDEFTEDFEKNKIVVEKYTDIQSKKLRNIVSGYVTRLTKSRETL